MKILVDVENSKGAFILNMLKQYSFVKAKRVAAPKAKLKADIAEAVEELKLVLAGKKEARNAEDFLNEL